MIYYCGHGHTDKSGNMYWIPGDADTTLKDTTFEYLSSNLLNLDEIFKIILSAQGYNPRESRYIIMSDCCSDVLSSKLYKGITYTHKSLNYIVVEYDSSFINNTSTNSILRSSLNLRNDTLYPDSSKPEQAGTSVISEFSVSEMIRNYTMQKNGNILCFSSLVGQSTYMYSSPIKSQYFDVAPICRRSLLYFATQQATLSLDDYLSKLTSIEFDAKTKPIIIGRSRNISN